MITQENRQRTEDEVPVPAEEVQDMHEGFGGRDNTRC